nr:GNAT family N-acetyltransferase [Chthonobacter rhizosphaerae]
MGASAVRLSLVGPDGEPAPISGLGGVKDGRRKERKLAKSGTIAFVEADAATLGPVLDRMIEQRLERFRAMGRPDLLDRPEVEDFYRRRAWNGLADGSVRVFALLVDGEILAVSYGLRRAGTLTIVVTSMTSDPRWTAFSPGLIIMVRAIEWAAAAGLHTVDLSVGALAYKTRFAATATELAEAQIPLTPLGLPLAACGTLRRWARRAMRRHPALARLRAGAGR